MKPFDHDHLGPACVVTYRSEASSLKACALRVNALAQCVVSSTQSRIQISRGSPSRPISGRRSGWTRHTDDWTRPLGCSREIIAGAMNMINSGCQRHNTKLNISGHLSRHVNPERQVIGVRFDGKFGNTFSKNRIHTPRTDCLKQKLLPIVKATAANGSRDWNTGRRRWS
jgi:hypothetical protein